MSLKVLMAITLPLLASAVLPTKTDIGEQPKTIQTTDQDPVDVILEPWTYTDDFEDRALGAWASYPHWQDIAYNQNFRVNEIVSGDPNISVVQKVTPYTNVDNYAGAQKLLDMYLVPGATVKFRYYLKANIPAEWYKVRFAAGEYGKLDVTIPAPTLNKWEWVTVSYDDFVAQNPAIAGKDRVKINALAFLTKFPDADPDMPIYLGLDDITFKGARVAAFQFNEPEVVKLPEFKPYIPKKHYYAGDEFQLKGTWVTDADKVTLRIAPYFDQNNTVYEGNLSNQSATWATKGIKLAFPEGLYLATLTARKGNKQLANTVFTIHIAPKAIGGQHPRLLFDAEGKEKIAQRFQDERYQQVYDDILVQAKKQREDIPAESLIYDLDQFPDENWLPTWAAWGSRIYHTGEALRLNARAYAFHHDTEAGNYVKAVLLRLAAWPDWTHPWQTKRGRFSEHRTGSWSHRLAEAYDLVYDFMSEDERLKIREAIMKNIVEGVHRTYVYNDNITAGTSNWLAMTVGGSLMSMAAIFQDGPDTEQLEPYFTGAILKLDKFAHNVTDSEDGAWGEGFGYNNYSFQNLSYSLPSLENVFHIDMSAPMRNTYNEYIWAGWVKGKRWFEYGDSGGNLTTATNWAYLLGKYKDPRLSWFYHFLRQDNTAAPTGATGEGHGTDRFERFRNFDKATYEDVVFYTEDIPEDDPFDENPVKVFRDIGTTVFKGGWETDDFVFVMRTGPFYNHQHIDQGSFWLADRGEIFIEERPLANSNYYDDPIYESWLTQPVGHSTILVNGNHQSQRTGDHRSFAPGFDDHAFISHFLDGKHASYVTGDIGKLYWGEVKSLRRNVLFLKPNAVLMLDVAAPAEKDAEINLLYQAKRFEDIQAGAKESTITKNEATLHIMHLAPQQVNVEAVKTPHYLKTLLNMRPLEREGMLTVTGKTQGKPLVMANLFTATALGGKPDVATQAGDGFMQGTVSGQQFAFSTNPGTAYQVGGFTTDALAIAYGQGEPVFVARATTYQDQHVAVSAGIPITFELSGNELHYYIDEAAAVTIRYDGGVSAVMLNGQRIKNYTYNKNTKELTIQLPAGEGKLSVK
ncbi:heparinase II/III domain-containing protein [Parapedobacter lycopersici]|uniref:heparinase II/III domain-containing protein n=1 Tax=Parapedobacter lycopersici TaxID=1864939 RepID=UPI00214DB01C|nr:heparinase II/III family protein [Parapedobacter lycopersici]